MKPHRGTLVLVLGILGLIICQPVGIAAWVMGNADLKQIAAGTMDPEGKSLTQIGKILGVIATVLLALAVIGFLLAMVLGIGTAVLAPHTLPR
ncbi:MAG: hypothetical protein WCQ16_00125 [Verrucomicrobiae bacterium]